MQLPIDIETVKGFLDPQEGEALFHLAHGASQLGPVLEVGSYCGKSTLYLAAGCHDQSMTVFAVDHHQGSEEHQPGEEYHDASLFDSGAGLMDSFKAFRHNVRAAGFEDTVVPVVAPSAVAARHWHTPLGMVFIDGGHAFETALTDYRSWASHIVPGGILAIHDIYPDPNEGGQAPFDILKLAVASGLFEEIDRVKSLGVLRRIPG